MAELGAMLASAHIKLVVEQIGSVIGGLIKLKKNFRKDLEKMKMALETVAATLEDAERQSIKDISTLLWLQRLKDAMFAISGMIDEFEAQTELSAWKLSLNKHLAVMIHCLRIGPSTTLANKMKTARKELETIIAQNMNVNIMADSVANEQKLTDTRETSSNINTQILGRSEETEAILAFLSENVTNNMVLAIYGMAGIGKTTLAQMIFNSSQFKDFSRVWVYVSERFDLKKIANAIILQLSKQKNQTYTDMQNIIISLSELLSCKNILIVLDDLCETDEYCLDKLKALLRVGTDNKVVVIVTTRNEDIAMKLSTIQPHKLAPLTHDLCWNIIKQYSSFESRVDKERLQQIGMDIAMKCGGSAIAAQSLGHMLQQLSFHEWELVRDTGSITENSSEDTSSVHALALLTLSYSHLPSGLKLCFAYCAIFPKGHKIDKDDLIHQWVSLGFIKATSMLSAWDLGERYIRQLLGLSLFQVSESQLITELSGITLLTMHDLVHDLARSVMADEILVASEHGNTVGRCCHYALLNDCSKPLQSSDMRALRFVDCGKIVLHDAAFLPSKFLRVLDLSECAIHKLPDSIGLLKHLGYLNAPRVQDSLIPSSITRLSKLIYLSLCGSSTILALPESIGEIGSLMYFDLSGCLGIKELPESFGSLKKLMHLDLSGCLGIKELPESFGSLRKLVHLDLSNCSQVGDVSKFLGGFTELQHLNLAYCSNIGVLPGSLAGLSKLQYLNLSSSSYLACCQEVEILGALTNLKYLNLSSKLSFLEKLPEAMGSFVHLKYLNLSGCHYLEELPKSFGNLKQLMHLDLSNCLKINGVPKALAALPGLQYLNLSRWCHGVMPRLKGLPEVIGTLTNLRYLNLSKCMSSIFETCSDSSSKNQIDSFMCRISTLSKLEYLQLSDNDTISSVPPILCNLKGQHTLDLSHSKNVKITRSSMALQYFVVHASDGNSCSNLALLQHMDSVELKVTSLENVKSAVEAESIKWMKKQRLEDLTLEWKRDAERFVDDKVLLEKLAPPSTLKKLEISGYNSISFPAWLIGQLPNLELLVLRGMENLKEWNSSYSSHEYIIEELELYDCPNLRMEHLPRAIKLKISNSDNVLSSWRECTVSHNGASTSSSPVTTILQVEYSKVPLYGWRLIHHLPGLTCLSASHCDDLTSSPDIIRCLSSLGILSVTAKYQEELPEWLGELTSLQQLNIVRYPGAEKLHDNMRQLTKLQSLNIYGCSMTSLPHWLGELTSLKTLYIFGCGGIRSLPEGIQQLCNLQELEIYNCPKLMHWVESEDNEMKLTNSQEMVCVLPTSLKKLVIWECHAIMSLPKGIHQLSDLQHLQILFCPLLKQWCESEENMTKLAHVQEKDIL